MQPFINHNAGLLAFNPTSSLGNTYYPVRRSGGYVPRDAYGGRNPQWFAWDPANGNLYRNGEIPELEGKVLFGDTPIGRVFYISADDLPDGGQDDVIRRVVP